MSDNRFILNGVLVFSILSLSIAYFIQYILEHKPCNLCIVERIPYLSAIVLISLIFIVRRFEIIFSTIVLLFFILGVLISFYHVGIEQGFFSESLLCNIKIGSENLMTNDYRIQWLLHNNLVCLLCFKQCVFCTLFNYNLI